MTAPAEYRAMGWCVSCRAYVHGRVIDIIGQGTGGGAAVVDQHRDCPGPPREQPVRRYSR